MLVVTKSRLLVVQLTAETEVGVLHKPEQETSGLDDLFSKSRVHNSQNVGHSLAGNWGEQAMLYNPR